MWTLEAPGYLFLLVLDVLLKPNLIPAPVPPMRLVALDLLCPFHERRRIEKGEKLILILTGLQIDVHCRRELLKR